MPSFIRIIKSYWISFTLAIGTILLAVPDKIAPEYGRICLILGSLAITVGLIAQYIQTGTADKTRREFEKTVDKLHKKCQAKSNYIDEIRRKSLFVVSSAITDPWQAELLHKLIDMLQQNNFSVNLFTPSKNHERGKHAAFLQQILQNKEIYAGGIVIPIFPEEGNSMYIDFMKKIERPLVFVDNPPSEDALAYNRNACFCGIDPREGGRLAAKAVKQFSKNNRVERVLVISAPSQTRRQEEFERELKAQMPDCHVTVCLQGDFDRATSMQKTLDYIDSAKEQRYFFDMVFCTSDAMTLGSMDAINSLAVDKNHPAPSVIGFDGVYETKMLARLPSSRLVNVVLQRTDKLSSLTLRQLAALLEGKPVEPLTYIEAELLIGN